MPSVERREPRLTGQWPFAAVEDRAEAEHDVPVIVQVHDDVQVHLQFGICTQVFATPFSSAAAPSSQDYALAPQPERVEVDPAKAALGRQLFDDTRVSGDGRVACSHCHSLAHGGAIPQPRSDLPDRPPVPVNVPSVFNAAFNARFAWNGRFTDVGEQLDFAIGSPAAMASSWQHASNVLARDAGLRDAFLSIYPGGVSAGAVREVLALYCLSLVTPNARFDRFLRAELQLTDAEQRGYDLFRERVVSERWLRASALASLAALVSLAGLIWLQHRAAQHSERYAQQLQSWLALESQQSAELLRVRSGLVGHYDGIVQTAAARRRALSALTPLPALVTGPGRAELERTLAQALSERVSTEWLIERWKREHSVLRISMRFLPRLAAELEPQRAGEVQEPWQGVANGIVQDALLFQHWQERDDTRLSPAHLPAKLMQPLAAGPATLDKASDPRAALLEQMEQMERQRIVQALAASDGNQTLAAEQLGISRRTLVTRLAQFDLPRPRKVRQRAGDGS